MPNLEYIAHYPEHLKEQIRHLIKTVKLGAYLLAKYPTTHSITSDKALYAYVMELRAEFLRKSEPITKVLYDGKISDINDALGLHRVTIKNHGGRLRSKSEIRVASVFKNTPEPFFAAARLPGAGPSFPACLLACTNPSAYRDHLDRDHIGRDWLLRHASELYHY